MKFKFYLFFYQLFKNKNSRTYIPGTKFDHRNVPQENSTRVFPLKQDKVVSRNRITKSLFSSTLGNSIAKLIKLSSKLKRSRRKAKVVVYELNQIFLKLLLSSQILFFQKSLIPKAMQLLIIYMIQCSFCREKRN